MRRKYAQTIVAALIVLAGAGLALASAGLSGTGDPPVHEAPPETQQPDPGWPVNPEGGSSAEDKEAGTVIENDPRSQEPMEPVGGPGTPLGDQCVQAAFITPTVTDKTLRSGTAATELEALTAAIQCKANEFRTLLAECTMICATVRPAYCMNSGDRCIRVWKSIYAPCWHGMLDESASGSNETGWTWKIICKYEPAPTCRKLIQYLECQ